MISSPPLCKWTVHWHFVCFSKATITHTMFLFCAVFLSFNLVSQIILAIRISEKGFRLRDLDEASVRLEFKSSDADPLPTLHLYKSGGSSSHCGLYPVLGQSVHFSDNHWWRRKENILALLIKCNSVNWAWQHKWTAGGGGNQFQIKSSDINIKKYLIIRITLLMGNNFHQHFCSGFDHSTLWFSSSV